MVKTLADSGATSTKVSVYIYHAISLVCKMMFANGSKQENVLAYTVHFVMIVTSTHGWAIA